MSSPELLDPILLAVTIARPNSVVLVDGPSGAGKSTLADSLRRAWPGEAVPTLVRLDDIYPGWDGLDSAIAHLRSHVLEPRRRGRSAAWQRFDWSTGRTADWTAVPTDRPLIVEGCGALFAGTEALSDVRVWLDADDALRKGRALARDGDLFREHWDQWQTEWVAYCAREQPKGRATILLRSR
ncbi:hypothetical protein JF66_08130 [Cryobacterium sp. MLB-32]|uniref:ATP-binding protein n=1 Tax=Cryobacterium sp. MLB-32 TaxID=1529318 RepID=UPI0004E7B1A2|nr:ATP-binding protein [Cryobacterium sp. MLB-32]KFF59908.1 hypothetical protein JF66_08130 [Cryobacterium sp. MLB-32]